MSGWIFGPISGTSSGPSVEFVPGGTVGPADVTIEAIPQAESDVEIEIG